MQHVDWFTCQSLFEAYGVIPPAELEAAYYRQNAVPPRPVGNRTRLFGRIGAIRTRVR
jgi:hypothetical protein